MDKLFWRLESGSLPSCIRNRKLHFWRLVILRLTEYHAGRELLECYVLAQCPLRHDLFVCGLLLGALTCSLMRLHISQPYSTIKTVRHL